MEVNLKMLTVRIENYICAFKIAQIIFSNFLANGIGALLSHCAPLLHSFGHGGI